MGSPPPQVQQASSASTPSVATSLLIVQPHRRCSRYHSQSFCCALLSTHAAGEFWHEPSVSDVQIRLLSKSQPVPQQSPRATSRIVQSLIPFESQMACASRRCALEDKHSPDGAEE